MRLSAAVLCLSLFASDALALNRARPNVARSFNWFQDVSATYRVFVGTIKMVGSVPKYVEGEPRSTKGVATGHLHWESGKVLI